MSDTTPHHLRAIDHFVGNNLSHVRNFHNQKTLMSQDRLREIQSGVTGLLETYIQKQDVDNQGALSVLQALKDYDWTTREGYISFREIHDKYQIENGGTVFPLF